MKKILLITLLILLVSLPTVASDQLTIENKIKADSPLYFLDKVGEKIQFLFTPSNKKPKVKFTYAYERLIEAKEMLEVDKDEKANKLFKEALDNFSQGVKLTTDNLVNDQDLKEMKEAVQEAMQEVKKTLVKKKISIEELKDTVKGFFDN